MSDLPPHDLAAERAVLGSMMLSRDALADCLEILPATPGAFFRQAHQIVYEAIAAMADAGQPVDALTIVAELERRGELGKAGGPTALTDMLAAVPVAANGPHYARRLLEFQTARDLGMAGAKIRQIAESRTLNREEMIEAANAALDEATANAPQQAGARSVASLLPAFLAKLEAGPDTTRGVMSGWRELDALIPGFRPGELIVVGGRPGMGKSIVLLNIAAHAGIECRLPVLLCSLEMSHDECLERIVSSAAQVPLTAIRDGGLSDDDWVRVSKAHGELADAETLQIEDNRELTIAGIRANLRAMRRAGMPAQLVVVDYMQLLNSAGHSRENRQLEVSEFSRGLKKLAGEFEVPVLVGSQLNRGPEMRSDHRPLPADLRESGSLEQDSDIVILLYRDDAYEQESPRSGEIDLIVAKNRQGVKATASLAFRGHYAECADLYRYAPEGPI